MPPLRQAQLQLLTESMELTMPMLELLGIVMHSECEHRTQRASNVASTARKEAHTLGAATLTWAVLAVPYVCHACVTHIVCVDPICMLVHLICA